jgi:hypothetical protein
VGGANRNALKLHSGERILEASNVDVSLVGVEGELAWLLFAASLVVYMNTV